MALPRSPWALLSRLRRFTVEVVASGDGPDPVPVHFGTGEISARETATPTVSAIVWDECGHWTAGPLAGTRFRNATLWEQSADEPGVRLSHLRRGRNRATYLIHLKPGKAGSWTAVEPHLCGPDRYFGALEWEARRLRLVWEVASPSDPYRLTLEAWTEDN